MVLEVKNLNKSYGRKKVLNNVSFKIEAGEILGFIGPNGAGKTTTIKLILGLQLIDSGEVVINGYDIKKDFVKAIEKVGAIVENPDAYMYLTGRKNLELIASLYKDVSKDKVKEIIKLVGLEKRIDDKVSKYSLGMCQRLGIASALLASPNLLILDEPTNGLDPEGIKELRDLVKRLAKEGVAVLISSHNLAELENFCTNVCIIKNGTVISESKITELKKDNECYYEIEVSKVRGLKSILQKDDEIIDDNIIHVKSSKKEVAELVKEIVQKGINVYQVKLVEASLEEAFLKETGGNIID